MAVPSNFTVVDSFNCVTCFETVNSGRDSCLNLFITLRKLLLLVGFIKLKVERDKVLAEQQTLHFVSSTCLTTDTVLDTEIG